MTITSPVIGQDRVLGAVNEQRIVDSFLSLVKINSPSGQERQVADHLKQKLTELGLEVFEDNAQKRMALGEKHKDLPNGNTGNVIGILKGTVNHAPAILFAAHMDTVVPNPGVSPVFSGGVIKTDEKTILGADDKAGIAALLEALRVIKDTNMPHGTVFATFTICEEIGLYGAKYLDRQRVEPQMAFVLDSGGPPNIVIGRAPFEMDYEIAVYGKAAHSGVNPEDGINALAASALAISGIRQGRINQETTLNIGIFQAGETTNTVCDRAIIRGEARSLKKELAKRQVELVREAFQAACDQFGARLEMRDEEAYAGFDLQEKEAVVQAAFAGVRFAGLQPNLAARGGGSDTNIFNGFGIPAVNLGVGASRDHTAYESVKVEDLVSAAKIVLGIVRHVANDQH